VASLSELSAATVPRPAEAAALAFAALVEVLDADSALSTLASGAPSVPATQESQSAID
jgi:hypothetical protein